MSITKSGYFIIKKKLHKILIDIIFVLIAWKIFFWWWNNHFLLLTLIVNSNCSFFQTSATKILKYEQLKFSINVNNKKLLFHRQKFIFDVIYTKIQFSVIFGILMITLVSSLLGLGQTLIHRTVNCPTCPNLIFCFIKKSSPQDYTMTLLVLNAKTGWIETLWMEC